jgi:hypothetical protein
MASAVVHRSVRLLPGTAGANGPCAQPVGGDSRARRSAPQLAGCEACDDDPRGGDARSDSARHDPAAAKRVRWRVADDNDPAAQANSLAGI